MPSELRSETARLNGAKSKGPTTVAGIEKSSQNATKHGLTSGSAIVLACEIRADFDNILNNFIEIYQPGNAAEKDLVEEMVAARWRIRRLWMIETLTLDTEIAKQESISVTGHRGVHLALAFRALADNSQTLHLTSRYESRLHRIYDHAYATLRELQQAREQLPPAPPAATAETEPPPGPEAETTKRTQDPTKASESNALTHAGANPVEAYESACEPPTPNSHSPLLNETAKRTQAPTKASESNALTHAGANPAEAHESACQPPTPNSHPPLLQTQDPTKASESNNLMPAGVNPAEAHQSACQHPASNIQHPLFATLIESSSKPIPK